MGWAFSAGQVVHGEARIGPRGGPQGGVAVLVLRPHKVIESKVIVPGCVLEVTVAISGSERRAVFVSIYLPPDSRREVIDAMLPAARPVADAVYAGGDVNLQAHAPRGDNDDNEQVDVERL